MIETPWVKTAKDLLNTKEIAGRGSNPTILGWAKKIGGWIAKFYTTDDIPWCGLFVGHCLNANGIKVPPDMLAAIAWSKYGKRLAEPKYGCIAVWKWANGRNHVSFIVGQDKNFYLALGGNQSNKVNIQKYPKSALISSRWPDVELQPQELPTT